MRVKKYILCAHLMLINNVFVVNMKFVKKYISRIHFIYITIAISNHSNKKLRTTPVPVPEQNKKWPIFKVRILKGFDSYKDARMAEKHLSGADDYR